MLIGTAERPLFAVLSTASGTRQRRAVVFCAPFGEEYIRTHRTGRLLAQRVAASGADALRFDYYGTGDSGGEDDEFTLAGAAEDARGAVAEAQAVGGVRQVTLIGLRHGAAAALLAADERGVDRLVLWDPVLAEVTVNALPHDTLMLVSEDSPAHQLLRARLTALSPRVAFEVVPGPPPWVAIDDDGIGAAPVEMLSRIAAWTP